MNAFWQWLIKADARRVFLCYLVLLALVIVMVDMEGSRPNGE